MPKAGTMRQRPLRPEFVRAGFPSRTFHGYLPQSDKVWNSETTRNDSRAAVCYIASTVGATVYTNPLTHGECKGSKVGVAILMGALYSAIWY